MPLPTMMDPMTRFFFVIHFAYYRVRAAACPFCNRILTTIVPCFAHIQAHFPAHIAHLIDVTGQSIVMYYQHRADNFLQTVRNNPQTQRPNMNFRALPSGGHFRGMGMNNSTRIRSVTLIVRPNLQFYRQLVERRRMLRRRNNNLAALVNVTIRRTITNVAPSMAANPNLETTPRLNDDQQEGITEINGDYEEAGPTRQYLDRLNHQYRIPPSVLDEPNGDRNDINLDLNLSL